MYARPHASDLAEIYTTKSQPKKGTSYEDADRNFNDVLGSGVQRIEADGNLIPKVDNFCRFRIIQGEYLGILLEKLAK